MDKEKNELYVLGKNCKRKEERNIKTKFYEFE